MVRVEQEPREQCLQLLARDRPLLSADDEQGRPEMLSPSLAPPRRASAIAPS